MTKFIKNIVRQVVRHDDISILALPYNGVYDDTFAELTQTSYHCVKEGLQTLMGKIVNIEEPYPHLAWLTESHTLFKHDATFDFILCHNRIAQWTQAQNLAQQLHIPILIIDHLAPSRNAPIDKINQCRQATDSIISIATNQAAYEAWNSEEIIYDAIPIPDYEDERISEVMIIGNFLPQEFELVKSVVEPYDNSHIVGHNPGLSAPFTSFEELEERLLQTQIYIHMATEVTLPHHLLTAMACGCAIVATKNPATESIFDSTNAKLVDSVDDIHDAVKTVLRDQKMRDDLGNAAKEIIQQHFTQQQFVSNWKPVLNRMKEEVYS